ncbi:MAG: sugar transferase, partial [Frankiales bacterium]|nr:sugar transferase [Frankiales bacterium]
MRAELLAPVDRGPLLPGATDARWVVRYTQTLVFVDLLALILAGALAVLLRFGATETTVAGLSYYGVASLLALGWLTVLALSRCYEARFLGNGPEEFKRVFNACVRVTALVALVAYAAQLEVARGFVGIVLPLGTVLLLGGRLGVRMVLHHRRRQGRSSHRVLVVGSYPLVQELVQQLRREPLAGLKVVGACIPGGQEQVVVAIGPPVPVIGSLTSVIASMAAVQADTVAVTASAGLQGEALRRLPYELEGTGVDLLVAPALTNVSGTRISIRPVAGLPLLHLD